MEEFIMAISLSKGQKISLAKAASDSGVSGGLTKILVGLGWDANAYDGSAFDLDASVFLTGADGKIREEADFVFYGSSSKTPDGKPCSGNGSVVHSGDNRTGAGDGDDEAIMIDLTQVPADVQKISVAITIYDAEIRKQNFGMVNNSYARVVDQGTGTELIKYDLGEDYSIETAIVACEIYRNNGEWKFNAVGQGWQGGLAALCNNFGIAVE